MAPKRIVLHDNDGVSQNSVDFFLQYPSVVPSSSTAQRQSTSIALGQEAEEKDLLGLQIPYVVSHRQSEAKTISLNSIKRRSPTRKALQSIVETPSIDGDTPAEYPDDTDYKDDIKEYEAWKLRRQKLETTERLN